MRGAQLFWNSPLSARITDDDDNNGDNDDDVDDDVDDDINDDLYYDNCITRYYL